jgi:hypothetical protein
VGIGHEDGASARLLLTCPCAASLERSSGDVTVARSRRILNAIEILELTPDSGDEEGSPGSCATGDK